MTKLLSVALVVAAGISGLALIASAAGTPAGGAKFVQPHGTVLALALDGSRVAYGNGPKVVVWNLATGKQTAVGGVGDAHLAGLAIAGSRVAWLSETGGNEEADDYLYTSALPRPRQRQVAAEVRPGGQCGAGRSGYSPACAGTWLGGVVGSGKRILVNRWTTDATGAIGKAGLYALRGTKLSPVATGAGTVEAAAADPKNVAVLQWRWHPLGTTVHVYSATGRRLSDVRPKGRLAVAISGRNLVVLERDGKLALYGARSGSLRRTFDLHAKLLPKAQRQWGNPRWLQALAVQGNIAIYSKPVRYVHGGTPRVSTIHAVNLSSGKDRVIGRSPGQIPLAQIDSLGLVYATDAEGYGQSRIVFVPLQKVAAAVS